uniref:Uncharacterized protein n=1 Tax=Anguilla anguilla TaxID=7936 RepID=A0A0E9PNM7_ANGAN
MRWAECKKYPSCYFPTVLRKCSKMSRPL